MKPGCQQRADQAEDGTEHSEIKNDAPGGFVHLSELFDLPVGDKVNKRNGKTEQSRQKRFLAETRLQRDENPHKTRNNRNRQCPGCLFVP